MVSWNVYWIRPVDRKKLLHGNIVDSEWFDPLQAMGVEPEPGEWNEVWLIKLNPFGDLPTKAITVDPKVSPDGGYELQNGDIQIPYGDGIFHFTQGMGTADEIAFAT
ncbi:MAG: hypothetical protein UY50_C0007G0005 [Parcubacteria group bacterium GW2011_GWA2_49_9]|nr:MAG: hypothetical protein UY50_C0007G0005 [Parcubacteria group bacterium GW2011_GWA2_49_9]